MKSSFVLFPFAFTSLLSAQTIYKEEDSFTKAIHYFTLPGIKEDVKLEGGSFWSGRYVKFTFHAIKPIQNQKHPFTLKICINASAWTFINDGESLFLKLNGQQILPLSGSGSANHRKVEFGDRVEEVASYPLTLDQLKLIAESKSIDFRIVGSQQTFTGTWKPVLLESASFFFKKAPSLIDLPEQKTEQQAEAKSISQTQEPKSNP